MKRYIIELCTGCWLAPGAGDPARTLVIVHAKQFSKEKSAIYALEKAKKKNPHRDFSDAKIVEIQIKK